MHGNCAFLSGSNMDGWEMSWEFRFKGVKPPTPPPGNKMSSRCIYMFLNVGVVHVRSIDMDVIISRTCCCKLIQYVYTHAVIVSDLFVR